MKRLLHFAGLLLSALVFGLAAGAGFGLAFRFIVQPVVDDFRELLMRFIGP